MHERTVAFSFFLSCIAYQLGETSAFDLDADHKKLFFFSRLHQFTS